MSFEQLDVWQRATRLSADLYFEMKELRDYGFRDQITRAGLSIPSNIAEGFERVSLKECVNFLSYAKGSCGELRTQIIVGRDIGYISQCVADRWINQTIEISAMLHGLIKRKRQDIIETQDVREKTQGSRRKT